jgi:hypothetical protein
MTSCLLVKASRRIVAAADGRLSVDDATKSFDTARKIRACRQLAVSTFGRCPRAVWLGW